MPLCYTPNLHSFFPFFLIYSLVFLLTRSTMWPRLALNLYSSSFSLLTLRLWVCTPMPSFQNLKVAMDQMWEGVMLIVWGWAHAGWRIIHTDTNTLGLSVFLHSLTHVQKWLCPHHAFYTEQHKETVPSWDGTDFLFHSSPSNDIQGKWIYLKITL